MFKLVSSVTILAMFCWVLPLGSFIKPSQEATACGGNRAFHMCSMMGGKAKTPVSGKVSFTSASSVEKTAKSSASSGNDLLPIEVLLSLALRSQFLSGSEFSFLLQSFQRPPSPPPKATF